MRKLKLALALLILGVSIWLARKPILVAAASYLVRTDLPKKADVIIVLGGDASGARMLRGCKLLTDGFADQIWVSGSVSFYGRVEGDLALEYAASKGCPAGKMLALRNAVDSTRDEAIAIGKMLHDRNFQRYLLVTSNFHTRRSGRVFREASPDLEAIVVAAEDDEFPVDRWWQLRHSRKTFLYEWIKTIGYWVGM